MGKTDKGNEFDVIVIGGGATGAGTARDCSMRGLRVLLLERFDYTNGATGRNHGLLHSGARYAVNDGESATECIKENMILRKIASHCVEENDGLFISLPEDDITYQARFIESCRKAGISAEAIDPKEAIRLEPSVNPALIGAVRVPDGSVDPFRLTMANVLDARAHGAVTKVYHEVTGFIREQDRIVGVEAYNHKTKEISKYYAPVVVNAAGIWGHHIAELAGVTVNMYPAKGSLLIFGHRVNKMVQLGDLGAHLHAELGVQVGQRFVHQEDLRLADDGAAQGDALALAAGERLRLTGEQVLDVQDLGRFLDAAVDLRLGGLAQLQTKGHVVVDGHVGIQSVVLENHRDVAILGCNIVDQLVADVELAVGNLFQAGDHAQRGGLTATRRSDQNDELLVLDVQREVRNCGDSAGIDLIDVLQG